VKRRFWMVLLLSSTGLLLMGACGETRRAYGEECLRHEDCLSGVCAARLCVSAPPLTGSAGSSPPNEEPRFPVDDAGRGGAAEDAPVDAASESS